MRKPADKLIIEAFEKSGGNLSAAAKMLGLGSRSSLYKYMAANPKLKDARDEAEEALLDMAESKLYSKVKAGDTTAIIFTLKTKGRKRGYIERQEIEIDKNAVINVGYGKDEDEDGD